MIYDLKNQNDIYLFKNQCNWLLVNKKTCELIKKTGRRTLSQNAALHLYFEHISRELCEMGITFNYRGLKGIEIEMLYNSQLVKEMVWKPIQMTLFKKSSTTELNNNEINEIITILSKFFSDRGVYIAFPSIQSLIDYTENN